MKLTHDATCEVCQNTIQAGDDVLERYDYDWDDPDEDAQGSISTAFYRHADIEICKKNIDLNRLAEKISAMREEDIFRKADQ